MPHGERGLHMPIEGRVARILTEGSIVVNRGSAQGVREGMRFVVFAELDEVPDPETGDSLGKLELVKARVVASHVQEKMTVCTSEPEPEAAPPEDPAHHTLSAEMIAVSMHSRGRAAGALDVAKSEITGLPKAGPIAVGDRVRSVES